MHRTVVLALRRHLRWLLSLLAAAAVWVLGLTALGRLLERVGGDADPREAALILMLTAVAFLVPVVLLAVALTQATRVFHAARHRAGRFTRRERAAIAQREGAQRQAHVTWNQAMTVADALVHGGRPPTIAVWDVVPLPGESFYADVPIGYARYYGTTVHYTQTAGLFVGRPAFVLAGLAGTALVNASARSAAQRQAADQWRERATVRLVVSDQRLLVSRGGQWISFFHSGTTAVYPDLERRALVCQYADTSPLMLWGDYGPLAAVVVVAATHGSKALLDHPAMASVGASMRAAAGGLLGSADNRG